MKTRKICCPKTSGSDYLVAKRHVPEERNRWFTLILSLPPNTHSAMRIKNSIQNSTHLSTKLEQVGRKKRLKKFWKIYVL